MVGSEKHWTVCRMYLEGCEIFSSFVLFSFSFNLTISLSLSPDCIRIDCNLSKCLLWLFTVTWFRVHALWYDRVPLPLFPHETQHNSFTLPHNSPCLLLLLTSTITKIRTWLRLHNGKQLYASIELHPFALHSWNLHFSNSLNDTLSH